MENREIEIPFTKNKRYLKNKKHIKKGIKIRTYFTYNRIEKGFSYTIEEEEEFLQNIGLYNKIKVKGGEKTGN